MASSDNSGWQPVNPVDEGGRTIPFDATSVHSAELVLGAAGIPCRRETAHMGFLLQVPERLVEKARLELEQYRAENRNWPPPLPARQPLLENQIPTLAAFALLCLFDLLLALPQARAMAPGVHWFEIGSARAGAILQGQWWRTLTALSLHSGGLHLGGNVVAGILIVGRLARELGSGSAWLLTLLAAAVGNGLNAWLQVPQHSAVGASTAVFAALGILAAFNLVRYRRVLWRRWALPLAGAAGLLAMIGASGERTDLGAHLFGLLAGLPMGGLAGRLGCDFWRRPVVNRGLGLLALLLLPLVWGWALLLA